MPNNNNNTTTLNTNKDGIFGTLKREVRKKFSKKKNEVIAGSCDNLEGNFTTNTLPSIDSSSDPDYISIGSTHSLNDVNASSDDESKANNKKNGVSEVTKVTDVKNATAKPLPLSDEEIFNYINLSIFCGPIKATLTSFYVESSFQYYLSFMLFKALVLHFAPDRNDDKVLKKLYKDFEISLENLYMNIPIQNNDLDLSEAQNSQGFYKKMDLIEITDENRSKSISLETKNNVSENPYMIMKALVPKDSEHIYENQSVQTLKI